MPSQFEIAEKFGIKAGSSLHHDPILWIKWNLSWEGKQLSTPLFLGWDAELSSTEKTLIGEGDEVNKQRFIAAMGDPLLQLISLVL